MSVLPASLPLRRLAVLVGVLVVLAIGGTVLFGGSDDDGPPRPDAALAERLYAGLLPGLCDATALAAERRVADAHQVFLDQAHQGLHVLAADVSSVDRAVAARLLQTKAAVEQSFGRGQARVAEDLPLLLEAARAALDRLGRRVPDPCR